MSPNAAYSMGKAMRPCSSFAFGVFSCAGVLGASISGVEDGVKVGSVVWMGGGAETVAVASVAGWTVDVGDTRVGGSFVGVIVEEGGGSGVAVGGTVVRVAGASLAGGATPVAGGMPLPDAQI